MDQVKFVEDSLSKIWRTAFHKFYFIHYLILCPIWDKLLPGAEAYMLNKIKL